jgi:D-3-phosphoglycerate dehydrogenase
MLKNILIDFDSTIISEEIVEVMFDLFLRDRSDGSAIRKKIKEITDQGMDGQISFSQSLKSRMDQIIVTPELIAGTIAALRSTVSPSFVTNINELSKNNLHIISGAFEQILLPLMEGLKISADRIHSNKFLFNNGVYLGVDNQNPLAHDKGKVKVAESLRLDGVTIMIGDGFSDYQVREAGIAQYFCYYAEHVERNKIMDLADTILVNFDEAVDFINNLNKS